jgi:RNA polymerase sigma-70 factor (sigma-E family)
MDIHPPGSQAAPPVLRALARPGPPGSPAAPDAETAVAASYEMHSLGLVRLAHVMLGDRAAAEDVVQDAFGGLYRRWQHVSDKERALQYVRSAVLNGCRTALRHRRPAWIQEEAPEPAASAEATVLVGEERREVMKALRRLPHRQREALVLRYYLNEPEAEIARTMGISQSTVRSTTHRALIKLGRLLGETS